MLDWVTGASRHQQDENVDPDNIPDTPAHIFAARAFKSLLFGTPAPNDATVEKTKRFSRLGNLSNLDNLQQRRSADSLEQPIRPPMQPRHSDPMASPSKGILVAPGSVSTKRKSVTFGGLGSDLGSLQSVGESIGQQPLENIFPAPPTASPTKAAVNDQPQDLRRTLFEQRTSPTSAPTIAKELTSEHQKQTTIEAKRDSTTASAKPRAERPVSYPSAGYSGSTQPEERTIDLCQPRSVSGQHWKREYERDHDNSKAEMKKLIQYNQMTKSYAEKRDRDAVTMTQRLNNAETKAKSLEKKIQKLTGQLMDARTQGGDQDSILSEVATQTAEVMKYQSKAERYRAALRRHEVLQSSTDEEAEAGDVLSTQIAQLKSEAARLKLAASEAESQAARAEKENANLNSKIKEMKAARILQQQQHDETSARLRKKEERLREDNQRLNTELKTARGETASLKQRLSAMNPADPVTVPQAFENTREKLFDLSYSRLSRPSTPPTSDEEFRPQSISPIRARPLSGETPSMNFSLTDNIKPLTPQHLDQQITLDNDLSDTFSIAKPTSSVPRRTVNTRPALDYTPPVPILEKKTGIYLDAFTSRNSSPLMKSFVDNLGTRRQLPPERIAAARKRLEEKAAQRRATPRSIR